MLSFFPERIKYALAEYEPSIITRYIYELCSAFNKFYHDCPIVGAETSEQKAFRLRIVAAVKNVLGNALSLICMRTPEKI